MTYIKDVTNGESSDYRQFEVENENGRKFRVVIDLEEGDGEVRVWRGGSDDMIQCAIDAEPFGIVQLIT